MTTKRPVVLKAGRLAELPVGDRVFSAGCVPFRLREGDTFHVPADMQALYSQPIVMDAGSMLILDGMLVETR